MKTSGKRYFTPEEYRRLSRNPFVDKKTLQFIKNKTVGQSGTEPVARGSAPVQSSGPSRIMAPQRSVRISDEAAQLVATAIRSMLRE